MKNSRATFAHTSLVLNSQYTDANPPVFDRTKAQDCIGVDRFIIRPQYRDMKEALHLAQGGTAGRVHKGMLSMQAQGRILVPNATQMASLEDREKALRLAFDPYECYRDSPSTDGVYALSWLEPTLDLTNYSTGWMAVTRYVRPVAQPETQYSITDQSYRAWSVGLVAPDPRLYEQTDQVLTLTPAPVSLGTPTSSPGAARLGVMVLGTLSTAGPETSSVVNKGNIASPLRVTLTMAGAGQANFTITRGTGSFVLDLSGCVAGDVVVVVMETCGPYGRGKYITKAGVETFPLKTSGVASWLDAPAGTTPFWFSNHHTNIATCALDWRHTRS